MNIINGFNRRVRNINNGSITVFGSSRRIKKYTKKNIYDLQWVNNDDERHREHKFNRKNMIKTGHL